VAAVTLGEANTPLLPLGDFGGSSAQRVWAKAEGANPTLSFKDRGMALAVSHALDREMTGLIVASTGNAAVSASAYAAAARLACTVIVGRASNAARKLDACIAYGATVVEVDGDYSDAYALAEERASEHVMNVSTTYQNPIIAEAYRAVAWEIVDQLGEVPDGVVVPIGAGPFLRGIWRGFLDLIDCGRTSTLPRMIGVQAAALSPLAGAYRAGEDAERAGASAEARRDAWTGSLLSFESCSAPARAHTAATAIADALRGYENHCVLTLEAVQESAGSIVAVGEQAIEDAAAALRRRGLWVEPSSATALAALSADGLPELPPNASVVLMLTGHGIKSHAAF
jgi:threonine synthase